MFGLLIALVYFVEYLEMKRIEQKDNRSQHALQKRPPPI